MKDGKSGALIILEKIKNIRIAKGITQVALSRELKISQNAYSKLELGRSNLDLYRLLDISNALAVDPIVFFLNQPKILSSMLEAGRKHTEARLKIS
ncbi:MAG: helix-turn-helix transcriptional regulator [Phormidesmis sp. FL-bin-119]|nr:helix-turn-helix transcriptional regulator [Pedobacter sp.]